MATQAPGCWQYQLRDGLAEMGIGLTGSQQRQLLDYLALLSRWNSTFNLTAVRDPDQMVSRQLLDSLSILDLVDGERVLDVGTGAGLPGIPLAVARPHAAFTLLDSNGKKTRFLEQVRMQLGRENVVIARNRAEQYRVERGFDLIVSRAFSSMADMLDLSRHLLAPTGRLLAMKGVLHADELTALRERGITYETRALRVYGSIGQRHAIICQASVAQSAAAGH